jgi:hypothetical protein
MIGYDEQARLLAISNREQCEEALAQAEQIEQAVLNGEAAYITDGDTVVGFAFPSEEDED